LEVPLSDVSAFYIFSRATNFLILKGRINKSSREIILNFGLN